MERLIYLAMVVAGVFVFLQVIQAGSSRDRNRKRRRNQMNTQGSYGRSTESAHTGFQRPSRLPPTLQSRFREDLLRYAIENFPNAANSADKLPDHLRQAYKTGDPFDLPTFGESRSALNVYFFVIEKPLLSATADEFLRQILGECQAICEHHRHNLSAEKRRLSRRDAYGNVFVDEWWSDNKGVYYFIDAVIVPAIGEERWSQVLAYSRIWNSDRDFAQDLVEIIDKAADGASMDLSFSEDMDGTAYEILCGQILGSAGWQVVQTPASGDQGVDLIAEKDNLRVCLQCKRYSSPVGNSCVQEVSAGKLHWHGSHAAVISNSEYTPSAKALADSNSVLLLHHDDLARLEEIIANSL